MEQIIKIDPLTDEEFVAKRSNQRFATVENKIRYHNKKNAEINKERAFFDKPCKKSEQILRILFNPKSDNIFHREFLLGMGLHLGATNRIATTKYGKLPAYYNYATRIIPDTDTIQIIKL